MRDVSAATPGPWGSRRLSTGIVITANGKDICKVPLNRYVSNDANEANARLIAAAPDLLEALTGILAAFSLGPLGCAAKYGPDVDVREVEAQAVELARDAIAKATP